MVDCDAYGARPRTVLAVGETHFTLDVFHKLLGASPKPKRNGEPLTIVVVDQWCEDVPVRLLENCVRRSKEELCNPSPCELGLNHGYRFCVAFRAELSVDNSEKHV